MHMKNAWSHKHYDLLRLDYIPHLCIETEYSMERLQGVAFETPPQITCK